MANDNVVPTTFRMEIELKAQFQALAAEALRQGVEFPSLAEFLNDAARDKLVELHQRIHPAKRRK